MITLRVGEAAAVILPGHGGAFTRLAWRGRDLLVPVPDGSDPNRGFHGAYLMVPWTNRLDGGRIAVGGVVHAMPINMPAEGTALHGFLRDLPWTVQAAEACRAVLTCRFDRAPFRGLARLGVALSPDRLSLDLAVTNETDGPLPLGIGWHPYMPRPPGTRLRARTGIVFGRDARTLPIGPRRCAGLDGGDAVLEGLDTHFAGWDGQAEILWPDGLRLGLDARGAWAGNLQVFAPPGRGVLAVEPVSHAPDAANRLAAAAHGAMHLVAPGEALAGSLTICWGDSTTRSRSRP